MTFLAKKNINTMEELEFNPEEINTQKHSLENKRKYVYGNIKCCRNADSKVLLQQDIETMTTQIKNRSFKIKKMIEMMNNQQKNQKIDKEYRNGNR